MTEDGHLTTMDPDPVWDAESYTDTVGTLADHADTLVYKVWGGDWCTDCRSQLPAFGAALEAAEVPGENVVHYPTQKEDDGSKTGPEVEEYDIEYIPTVVVERKSNGEEVARFVEKADMPIAVYLADQLEDLDVEA